MIKPTDWLFYAEDDLRAAKASASQNIVSAACFHAHQTVEKCLKALLLAKEGEVPKTHDLEYLIKKVGTYKPEVSKFNEACELLNQFYTPMRYPDALPGTRGSLPTLDDAQKAIEQAESILVFVKPLLQK